MRFQVHYPEGLHREKMLCVTAVGGGVRVMDAEKLSGWQEREETIWAFWDCVRVHLQIGWQQQRGHVVRVDVASCSRARGEGNLTSPPVPEHVFLQPFLIASQGIFNSCSLRATFILPSHTRY